MTAAFTSRLPEWEAALAQALPSAARAMGEAAVQAVRAQMLTGYARPVYDTGALHADVRCRAEGASVLVGNTLPYAPMIYDGTVRMAACRTGCSAAPEPCGTRLPGRWRRLSPTHNASRGETRGKEFIPCR